MADDLTVARPYARAAFSYADENNALDSWKSYLTALSALIENSGIADKADVMSADDTVKYASDILMEYMDEKQTNFFRLLLENKRLKLVPYILSEYLNYVEAKNNSVCAVVTSARPLTENVLASIKEKIQQKFKVSSVVIKTATDPSLMAGFTVKVKDQVFDASIRTRLNRLIVSLGS
ncbi:F0F1 ATP synthase subunit delta [Succinimonas amylolytica]|jgi:F-type H+-transporting ATPase subunit delta|uniref:F0F1 ATP synthase subunit delta n=1 Tax=Succinimonas amylolytica TaxID=83769 RepID=UPI00037BC9CD|nr:F0F1 ATP synthase subunit delta [Succinimonas amylolytica]